MEGSQEYLQNRTLSNKIADPTNWKWRGEDKSMWIPAGSEWQEIREQWYGNESISLLTPKSVFPSLNLKFNTGANIVRQSYLAAFDTIWLQAMVKEGRNGVILIDQPGVEMNPFSCYLFLRLLQMKQVVVCAPSGSDMVLFYHDGVYDRGESDSPGLPQPTSSSGVFIWSLFSMWKKHGPAPSLVDYPCFPVQVAPPDSVYFGTWRKARSPLMTGLPVWTYEELAQGLQYQSEYHDLMPMLDLVCDRISSGDEWRHLLESFISAYGCLEHQVLPENIRPTSTEDAMEYILDTSIAYFGYKPHEVFQRGVLGNEMIDKEGIGIPFSALETAAFSLADFRCITEADCQEVLAITPSIPTHGALTWVDAEWNIDFTSDWIARKVIQGMRTRRDSAVGDENDILRSIVRIDRRPETQRLAARFLEPFVHRCIAGTTGTASWPLIQMILENENDDAPRFRFPSADPAPAAVRLAKIKREVVSLSSVDNLASCLKDNTYYIPEAPSFPLFDAFTVELDRKHRSAVLWMFQIITSRVNGGSFMGYKKVRDIIAILKDALHAKESPRKKRKTSEHDVDNSTPSVEVRYVLVVPKRPQKSYVEDLESFVRQFPNRWPLDRQKHDHCGKVYYMEVPLNV